MLRTQQPGERRHRIARDTGTHVMRGAQHRLAIGIAKRGSYAVVVYDFN